MDVSYRFTQNLSAYQQKYKTTLYGTTITFDMLQQNGAQQIRDWRDDAHAKREKHDRKAETLAWIGGMLTVASGSMMSATAAWVSGITFASALVPLCVRSDIQDRRARKLDLAHALVAEDLTAMKYEQTIRTLLRHNIIEKKPAPDRMAKLKWYTPPA